MFTVNKLDCSYGLSLSLGKQWVFATIEEAIDNATSVVLETNPDLDRDEVKDELELGKWISEDGDSGVFIGQTEN